MASGRSAESLHCRVAAGVRAELARHGVSVSKMADRLGISHRTFRRRLAGEGAAFDCDEIEDMADFLGVDAATFLSPSVFHVGDLHVTARDVNVHHQG